MEKPLRWIGPVDTLIDNPTKLSAEIEKNGENIQICNVGGYARKLRLPMAQVIGDYGRTLNSWALGEEVSRAEEGTKIMQVDR